MEPNFSRAGNALSMLQDPTLSPTSKSRGFAQIDPSLLLKNPKQQHIGGPQVVPVSRTAEEPQVMLLPDEPARQIRDAAQPYVLRTVNAEVLLIDPAASPIQPITRAVYARLKLSGNFVKNCSDDWCALHNQPF